MTESQRRQRLANLVDRGAAFRRAILVPEPLAGVRPVVTPNAQVRSGFLK